MTIDHASSYLVQQVFQLISGSMHPNTNGVQSETRSLGFGFINKSQHSKQDNNTDDALFY